MLRGYAKKLLVADFLSGYVDHAYSNSASADGSGLWHGADWTFVIWGGLHGIYLIAERLLFKKRAPGRAITFFLARGSFNTDGDISSPLRSANTMSGGYDPNRSILEPGWFYVTNFHLNESGAVVFTKGLIEDLKILMGDTVGDDLGSGFLIYVPAESLDRYCHHYSWQQYSSMILPGSHDTQ